MPKRKRIKLMMTLMMLEMELLPKNQNLIMVNQRKLTMMIYYLEGMMILAVMSST